MTSEILAQGAEAVITLSKDIVNKKRTKKSYRLPLLDEKIRKQRIKEIQSLKGEPQKITHGGIGEVLLGIEKLVPKGTEIKFPQKA